MENKETKKSVVVTRW